MYLRALATATPPHSFTQEECLSMVQGERDVLARLDRRSRLMLRAILRGDSGIATRQFAVREPEKLFRLDADGLNAEFRQAAPTLAARALDKALDGARLRPADLDALIVTTCTGYLCPGVSSYVAEQLGLRPEVWLQDIVGLGCGAAIPALRAASSIVSAEPQSKVACLSVEICSAAFFLDSDPGVVVSACLFGDGAAATIWQGGADDALLRCGEFSSLHQPQHRDLIRFEQREGKLRNLLHPTVPQLAAEAVASLYQRSAQARPVAKILSHAGGRDVIEAIEKALPGRTLPETREVLRHHGNMSSPSVLFALERALQSGTACADGDWWMVAFGAGFSAHACRLSVV